MAAVLAVLLLLALIALGVFVLLWLAATRHNTRQARLIRHQCERIDGYRAELDALSITPPATAVAALCPDDPSLLAAEVEQWLRTRESR